MTTVKTAKKRTALTLARAELSIAEVKVKLHNPTIIGWLAALGA